MDLLAYFRTPSALFLLVIPAAIVAWVWTRRGSAVALPLDHATAPKRSWTDLMAGFMEEKNILWGELVGGLLILFGGVLEYLEGR